MIWLGGYDESFIRNVVAPEDSMDKQEDEMISWMGITSSYY